MYTVSQTKPSRNRHGLMHSLPRPLIPLVTILYLCHRQNAAFTGTSAQTSLPQLFSRKSWKSRRLPASWLPNERCLSNLRARS